MDPKAKFLQIYANLPSGARKEIIAVVNDQPYTWNASWLEIDSNTKLGTEILETLVKLKIVK